MRDRGFSRLCPRSLNRSSERSVERFVIDQLRSLVDAAGPFGPAAFVAAYAVLTVALVPGTIPSLAAGALFGPVWGSLLVIAGATVGAVGAFEVARRIGRSDCRRCVAAITPLGPRSESFLAASRSWRLAIRLPTRGRSGSWRRSAPWPCWSPRRS